jgi:hypothetical protein
MRIVGAEVYRYVQQHDEECNRIADDVVDIADAVVGGGSPFTPYALGVIAHIGMQ